VLSDSKRKGDDERAVVINLSAIIAVRGMNPYILVKPELAQRLKPAWRRPLPVILRITSVPQHRWKTNIMPVGDGSFYLYLHGLIRRAAAANIGDRIRVQIQFNAAYRGGPTHPMRRELRDALCRAPHALRNWQRLIPSRKKEILRYLAALKSPEARARNIARALSVLSGHEGRFMGRDWRDGS
jgi:Bacteriocin-protection, YdeI or OmpD-Associated/Domain of unknown function (DUF1905)